MVTDDTLLEAINDSIAKEKEAQRFYQEAADKVDKAAIKEFFIELKSDELGHERMLTRVRDDLRSGKLTTGRIREVTTASLADMGISRYLKAKKVKPKINYQEAMVVAMKREEEAWRNYMKLSKMSDNDALKDLFLLLAQVEAGHLRRIEGLYEKEVLEGY
jgi:rubrerythrin